MEQIIVVLKMASWVPVTHVASLIEDKWLVTLVLSLHSSVLLRLFTALLRPCVYHSLPCGTPPAWGASNLLTTGNVLTVRLIFLSRHQVAACHLFTVMNKTNWVKRWCLFRMWSVSSGLCPSIESIDLRFGLKCLWSF